MTMMLYPFEQLPSTGVQQLVGQYIQAIRHCRDRQHAIYRYFVQRVVETIKVEMQQYGFQHIEVQQQSVYDAPTLILQNVDPIWATRLVKLFEAAYVPFLAQLQQHASKAYTYAIRNQQFGVTQHEDVTAVMKYSILQQATNERLVSICSEHLTQAEETWIHELFNVQLEASVATVNAYLQLLLAKALEEIDYAIASHEQTIYWGTIEQSFKTDALLFTQEGQFICTLLQYMKDDQLQQRFSLDDKEAVLDTYAYISDIMPELK